MFGFLMDIKINWLILWYLFWGQGQGGISVLYSSTVGNMTKYRLRVGCSEKYYYLLLGRVYNAMMHI